MIRYDRTGRLQQLLLFVRASVSPDLIGKARGCIEQQRRCVIARSEEAKALGYKMGDPFYQVKEKLEAEGVAIFRATIRSTVRSPTA